MNYWTAVLLSVCCSKNCVREYQVHPVHVDRNIFGEYHHLYKSWEIIPTDFSSTYRWKFKPLIIFWTLQAERCRINGKTQTFICDTHTQCRTPWMSDKLIARPLLKIKQHTKQYKHPYPKRDSNPRSEQPGSQTLRLRPYGHHDCYKQDLHCLLKLRIASIIFGGDFCLQFLYNI